MTTDPSAKARSPSPPTPTKPIWSIENVVFAFHLEVDSAREYTYLADFAGAVEDRPPLDLGPRRRAGLVPPPAQAHGRRPPPGRHGGPGRYGPR